MAITTHVVHRSWWAIYRTHGYFFREAAMLTIGLGVALHIYRVIFGDQLALKYAITPLTDRILLIPMTYAAVTGIALLARRRVICANRRHRALFTGSVVYIAGSVPLHVYCSYVIVDTTLVTWFPMWFSYLLLIVVYPVFLTMFWRLHYRN